MELIKPKTYGELMQYKRCLELQMLVPEVKDDLFVKVYRHLLESPDNSIDVSDGNLVFNEKAVPIDNIEVAASAAYTMISLTAVALTVERPFRSYGSGGYYDGGSSGNNNNNNNNNNG